MSANVLCFQKSRKVFYLDSVEGFHQFFHTTKPEGFPEGSSFNTSNYQVAKSLLLVVAKGTHITIWKNRHDIDLFE